MKEDKELYKNYIRFKANYQPLPYWIRHSELEGEDAILPENICKSIKKTAQKYFPEVEFSCSDLFSETAIDHIIDACFGANIDSIYNDWGRRQEKDYLDSHFPSYLASLKGQIIDGVGDIECEDFELCQLTFQVLQAYGVNEKMLEEEVSIIAKMSKTGLRQDDYDKFDLILANYDLSFLAPVLPVIEKEITDFEKELVKPIEKNSCFYLELESMVKRKLPESTKVTYSKDEVAVMYEHKDKRIKDMVLYCGFEIDASNIQNTDIIDHCISHIKEKIKVNKTQIEEYLVNQKIEVTNEVSPSKIN